MKDRLVKFIKNEGLTPSRFAEIMDIPASSVSHLIAGRNKPGYDFIFKIIQRFPRLNPDWLIVGSGPMYRPITGSEQPLPVLPSANAESAKTYEEESILKGAAPEAKPFGDPTDLFNISPPMAAPQAPMVPLQQIQEDSRKFQSIQADKKNISSAIISATASSSNKEKPTDTEGEKQIERIIIFYNDHTFASFGPENK